MRTDEATPRDATLRADAARYESEPTRIIVLSLSNGYVLSIPVRDLPEVSHASDVELAQVALLGGGRILHWESLDADYSVPALVARALGPATAAKPLSRRGGKASTDAKAAAARADGKKGGRPGTRTGAK